MKKIQSTKSRMISSIKSFAHSHIRTWLMIYLIFGAGQLMPANAQCNTCTGQNKIGVNSSSVTNASSLGPNASGFSGATVCINGKLIIDVNTFQFISCNVLMGINAVIEVQSPNVFVVANTSTIKSCDQQNSWTSIEALSGSTVAASGGSTIQDALYGVRLNGSAFLQASFVTFNRNLYGVYFNGTQNTQLSAISNCDFRCELNGVSVNLLAPYNTQRSVGGIMLNNVAGFSSGASAIQANRFFNQQQGVLASLSYYTINNNDFFYCDYGIYSKKPTSSTGTCIISNNDFEYCPYGVWVTSEGKKFNIYANSFSYFTETAITVKEIKNSTCNIYDNYFNCKLQNGVTVTDPYSSALFGKTAIYCDNLSKGQYPLLDIYQNHVNNSRYGIHIRNINGTENGTYGAKIRDNEVFNNIPHNDLLGITQIPPPPSIGFLNGSYGDKSINIENSNHAKVFMNMLQRPADGGNTNHFGQNEHKYIAGIYVENSIYLKALSENITDNIANSIYFKGVCIGTQMVCNTANAANNGISIGWNHISTTACEISSQKHGVNTTNKNIWQYYIADAYRRVTGYNNNANGITWASHGNATPPNTEYGFCTYTFGTVTQLNSPQSITCAGPVNIEIITSTERDELLYEIITGTHTHDLMDDAYDYWEQKFAYEMLTERQDLLNMGETNDIDYQNFYTNCENGNIGRFAFVQQKINEEQYAEALSVLETITPGNHMEENMYACYLIYLNTFAVGIDLSDDDRLTLTAIASEESTEGGEGVMWARAMLDIIAIDDGSRKANEDILTNGEEKFLDKAVFPNPVLNTATVKCNATGNLQIKITDVTGRLVLQTNVQSTNDFIEFNTDQCNSGYYNLQVLQKNQLVVNTHFVK